MCGMTGFSGNFDKDLLQAMTEEIEHRGPDDVGIHWDPDQQIGLGHRRLSIIDLSPMGHQPMWDQDKRAVIAYNGEIYNFKECRASLEKDGFRFRGHSDTEVLLNLYLRDGKEMLSKLNGIFAFAIWDTIEQHLFLARDGVGIKPLYYSMTPKGFLFSSELKSLLRSQDVRRQLDPASIHFHLNYQWSPSPHTVLRSVRKLEPGYAMIVKEGKITKKWMHYDLPYEQPISSMSVEEAVEGVRTHVRQAVQRQMVADVPVGAFLSGGLDSSSVVAFANQTCKVNPLECFTIGFKGSASPRGEGRTDDLPYAKKVAQHLGVKLNTIYVGPEIFDQIERMVYHLDEPQADFAPIHVYFISKMAHDNGMKVLLSGAGGDDIFTGYNRHVALNYERFWSWLPRPARSLLRRVSRRLPTSMSSTRRIAKAFQYADLDDDQRIASYFHAIEPFHFMNLYSKEFSQEIEHLPFASPFMKTLGRLPAGQDPINRMLYLEGKHFLTDHNLNYTDKMSMATGVEVRVPLLDPTLIDYATRLPVHYKQKGRVGKWIFKKAMEPFLPHEVIYRPKTGFGVPVRRWLKKELRHLVEETLSEKKLRERGIFDPKAVHRFLDLDRKGKVDGANVILAMICLECWMTIFLDRKSSYF